MKHIITRTLILFSFGSIIAMDNPNQSLAHTFPKPQLRYQAPLASPQSARFTVDGKRLVVGSAACKFVVFDTSSNYSNPLLTAQVTYNASPIDCNPIYVDAAAIGSCFLPVAIWNITSGKQQTILPDETKGAFTLEYNKAGTQILNAGQGAYLTDLESNTSQVIGTNTIQTARFCPSNNNLVAMATACMANQNGIITLWDLRANKTCHSIDPKLPVFGLKFNPDGSKLLSISNFDYQVWDTSTGTLVKTINLKGDTISKPIRTDKKINYADTVVFTRDTNTFIAASALGKITICDLDNEHRNIEFDLADGAVSDAFAMDISPDGSTLVTGLYEQNEIKIWDICAIRDANPLADEAIKKNSAYRCDLI